MGVLESRGGGSYRGFNPFFLKHANGELPSLSNKCQSSWVFMLKDQWKTLFGLISADFSILAFMRKRFWDVFEINLRILLRWWLHIKGLLAQLAPMRRWDGSKLSCNGEAPNWNWLMRSWGEMRGKLHYKINWKLHAVIEKKTQSFFFFSLRAGV